MTRAARLRRRDDIAAVRAEGRAVRSGAFSARIRRSELNELRIAVVAPRTVGGAVVRNRARRRVREAFRRAAAQSAPADVLVTVRSEAISADFGTLERDARAALAGARS